MKRTFRRLRALSRGLSVPASQPGAERPRFVRPGVLILGFLGLAGLSQAHHSGAPFDTNQQIEVSGVVEHWHWQNPHAWLRLQVPDGEGNHVEWNIEATSPNILLRQGWRRTTLEPGDEVTVLIHPLRDGNPGGSLLGAKLSDGTELGAPPGSGGAGAMTSQDEN